MSELEIQHLAHGRIIMRGDGRKIGGPFKSRADTEWFLDAQRPKRDRIAGVPDAQFSGR